MRLTLAQYLECQARLDAKRGHVDTTAAPPPVAKEIPLHEEIIKYCAKQWPPWKFRHARTDKRTTEEIGVEDFTLFLPGEKTLHIECKARDEKQTKEQLIWAKQLEMLGHRVYVVRNMEEFMKLVND